MISGTRFIPPVALPLIPFTSHSDDLLQLRFVHFHFFFARNCQWSIEEEAEAEGEEVTETISMLRCRLAERCDPDDEHNRISLETPSAY